MCKNYFVNFTTKERVLCPWHGQVIKWYEQLSIPWIIVHIMDNCQKNGNLSTERVFVHSMDNCPWHGKAMKCLLTVCLFVLRIVSDQNCPQDLDLSRKILTSLTTLSQLNCTKSVHNVSKILHPIKYIKHMKPPKKNDS